MRRALLAIALALAFFLPGCLGSVDAAEIPESSLDDNGWQEKSTSSSSVVLGIGEKVTKEYVPASGLRSIGAGVTVVTANDVPIIDESRFIPEALERIEEQQGISFEKTGTNTLELVNLETSTTADVYDVNKNGQQGRAVLFTPSCSSFVVVVGWGATAQGLTNSLFQEARSVARTVVC